MLALFIFNLIGLIAFMISGALMALKKKMDVGGVIFLAATTGVGGGTIRDVLLGIPVFWMEHNEYLYLAILTGCIAYGLYHIFHKRMQHFIFGQLLQVCDIMGVIAFMIATVATAKAHHQAFLSTLTLSVITCIGGGVMRDVICGETPQMFREFYAVSVALCSALYLLMLPMSTEFGIFISCLFFPCMHFFIRHFQKVAASF